jgi:PAS domain S-box-containing protein
MGTWDWCLLDHSMHWDERMHTLFGLAPSTFSGRYEQFLELIHAENRQQVAREFAQALERRAEYDGEFRVVWPTDGRVHALRARSKVVCDNQGKPVRVTGVSWDVSERSQMENALARESFLLKTLMDNLPDHIYFKDRESRFIAVNRAMAALFGLEDPADVLGKTDADLFTCEHAQAALRDEQEILRTGQPLVNMEERRPGPMGMRPGFLLQSCRYEIPTDTSSAPLGSRATSRRRNGLKKNSRQHAWAGARAFR